LTDWRKLFNYKTPEKKKESLGTPDESTNAHAEGSKLA
jgi:hypothetical protein